MYEIPKKTLIELRLMKRVGERITFVQYPQDDGSLKVTGLRPISGEPQGHTLWNFTVPAEQYQSLSGDDIGNLIADAYLAEI